MYQQNGDHPVPPQAIWIWRDGQDIKLGFPPMEGNDKGHTVSIPLEKCSVEWNNSGTAPLTRQLGWKALLDILQARQTAAANGQGQSIGMAGDPVQDMVRDWLKAKGFSSVPKYSPDGQHIATVEELGLGEAGELEI